MTTMITRAATAVATAAVAATVAGVGHAGAAPALPGLPAPHQAASLRLADWYGTAWVASVTAPDNGVYALSHDGGRSPVVLEQRSVKYRKKVGTPWKRLAIVRAGQPPTWGTWSRLAGFDGKQFRLCRVASNGAGSASERATAASGKQCTAYSNIIVP